MAGAASSDGAAGRGVTWAGSGPVPPRYPPGVLRTDAPAEAGPTAPASGSLLLPVGTRLVHIGPPAGTATLQTAFHFGRRAAADQGVHYAGPTRQPVMPILAVTGRPSPTSGKPPSMRLWRSLVGEIGQAREDRVVVSSELFADAGTDAIRTVAGDLGATRVHVVATLRPLASTLPAQWQQFVQAGLRSSYDDWLTAMFDRAEGDPVPTFWHRHRHDRLIARWADVVGPGNVTVVVQDDPDDGSLLRTFEQLVGLHDGTLATDAREIADRTLTWPEAEVVRAFNQQFWQEGLGMALHARVMRYGAASYMKTREPAPDEASIQTPGWAIDRATAIAREMVDAIAGSGVRVVGDLERLTVAPEPRRENLEPVITPDIAATAAVGVVLSSGLAKGGETRIPVTADTPEEPVRDPGAFIPRPTVEPLALVRMSTPQLIGVVVRRGVGSVVRRIPIVGRGR